MSLPKLHLGCGSKHIPGWIHIDAVEFPHITLQHEVSSLPMLKDDSAQTIYACHVLEHFHRREVPRVLHEWKRILCPGGVLRLAVPNFAAVAIAYSTKAASLKELHGLIFGRQDYLYNIHNMIFDEETLTEELLGAGFANPHRYDWRTTEHADLDDYSQAYLPHLDKEHGMLMSLNMEAVKP